MSLDRFKHFKEEITTSKEHIVDRFLKEMKEVGLDKRFLFDRDDFLSEEHIVHFKGNGKIKSIIFYSIDEVVATGYIKFIYSSVKGEGAKILEDLERKMEAMGMEEIQLASIPEMIPYYGAKGYEKYISDNLLMKKL